LVSHSQIRHFLSHDFSEFSIDGSVIFRQLGTCPSEKVVWKSLSLQPWYSRIQRRRIGRKWLFCVGFRWFVVRHVLCATQLGTVSAVVRRGPTTATSQRLGNGNNDVAVDEHWTVCTYVGSFFCWRGHLSRSNRYKVTLLLPYCRKVTTAETTGTHTRRTAVTHSTTFFNASLMLWFCFFS